MVINAEGTQASIDAVLDKAVSRVLRELMHEGRLKQKGLSASTGIAPRTLIRIMNGERPATLGEVRLLADAFGVTAAEIAAEAERLIKR